MKYSIKELNTLSLLYQEVKLTNSKIQNIQIVEQFWKVFNRNLKKSNLSQSSNWIKYAFMERRNEELFYSCAIPMINRIPIGFMHKEIKAYKYLVVEHIGSMSKIYSTYEKIYNEIFPNINYEPCKIDFLHFERYDYRFSWNQKDSIIEIWIPINN